MISWKFASQARIFPKKNSENKYITANGEEIKSNGESDVNVSFGNYTVIQNCEVIQNFAVDVLLSTDVLVNQGTIIDYKHKNLVIGSTKIPLIANNSQREVSLSIENVIEIKSNSKKIVWSKIPFKTKKPLLIESNNKIDQQWRNPDYIASEQQLNSNHTPK